MVEFGNKVWVCRMCGVERNKGHATQEIEESCKKKWRETYRGFKSFWVITYK